MEKTLEIDGHLFKIRRWTYGQKQAALKKITTWSKDPTSGNTVPDVDPWRLNDEMILTCLISWDIKNESGNIPGITLEALHDVEPAELMEKLLEEIQALNGVSLETRKK